MPSMNKEELLLRIKKNTGFPAEIRVARDILRCEWSYISNPVFSQESGMPNEIDFIANTELSKKYNKRPVSIEISVLIDVKSYNRPLILFSSPWTDFDFPDAYSRVTVRRRSDAAIRTRFNLMPGLVDFMEIQQPARSAVIVNNKGEKASDFDFHQIHSSISKLYHALQRLDDDRLSMHEDHLMNEINISIIIPLLVFDGTLFNYTIENDLDNLTEVNAGILQKNTVGENDRRVDSPVYITSVENFPVSLAKVRKFFGGTRMERQSWIIKLLDGHEPL